MKKTKKQHEVDRVSQLVRDTHALLRRAEELKSPDPTIRRGAIRWWLLGSDGTLGRLAEAGLTMEHFGLQWVHDHLFGPLAGEVEEALQTYQVWKTARSQALQAKAA